jgi:hypothetical protein
VPSGDQLGKRSRPEPVTSLTSLPSAFITHTRPWLPNAIRRPSGDQLGRAAPTELAPCQITRSSLPSDLTVWIV